MLVVGLTGGIATGKSTVSSILKERNVPVVDADVIARQVVEPGKRAYAAIVKHFGAGILRADGSLDRPKLGAAIFGDEGKRKLLNSIVHPAVRREMARQVLLAWLRGVRYCIIDVPLLIETGLHNWVGMTVVVSCLEETQRSRLLGRDKLTEEAAAARIQSQMPIREKASYADVVIDNSGSLEALRGQVEDLIVRLETETRWIWVVDWIVLPFGILNAILTLAVRRLAVRTRQGKSGSRRRKAG